jgi:hypothetical protein
VVLALENVVVGAAAAPVLVLAVFVIVLVLEVLVLLVTVIVEVPHFVRVVTTTLVHPIVVVLLRLLVIHVAVMHVVTLRVVLNLLRVNYSPLLNTRVHVVNINDPPRLLPSPFHTLPRSSGPRMVVVATLLILQKRASLNRRVIAPHGGARRGAPAHLNRRPVWRGIARLR